METNKEHDIVVTCILFNFYIFQLLAILELLCNYLPSSPLLEIIEEWYESFNVHITLHNLDLALRVDVPSKPTDVSSADERSFYERWEHSNRSTPIGGF